MRGMIHDRSRDAIGWYIHLPFCPTKCGYCDFYSLPTLPDLVEGLVDSIIAEIESRDPLRAVETIFVGGGTPTVLPAGPLERLLRFIAGRAERVDEWTVEANPSSTDELKLDLLRGCGVTRLSLGAQSFNPRELAVLERLHDADQIEASFARTRAAGFDNVNLDFIYAIPGQSLDDWLQTLRRAVDLGPDHLSCYALTYEPGTSLTRLRRDGRLLACDEDLEAGMFDATIETLTAAGYEHYEVSNFARPGRRCRANLRYWRNEEYLGVGPSAVSYIDGRRSKNAPDARRYVESRGGTTAPIVVEDERLDEWRTACETAVQMLRLTDGIERARFIDRIGLDPAHVFAEPIGRMTGLGLIESGSRSIRLTRRGLLVANRVMEEFLLERPAPCAV
jgi:oxygen-independent coproporphyrinogen-3 oxidase